MGIYATLLSLGFATGPFTIAVVGYDSVRPFLIGSLLLVVAGIPAMLAHRHSPRFRGKESHGFTGFILAVPMATFGVFCFAMAESSGFAFLPLWGKALGYSDIAAPLLASAMTLGNVVFQIPLGLVADRTDRRIVLLFCGLVGALGMVAAWLVAASPMLLMAILFVWGGATAGLYTVGLAHLAGHYRGPDLANANAAFIFCYALGMLAGPAAVGDSMARNPLSGFPALLGAVFLIYSMVAAHRILSRKGHSTS
jgi:MFS family permease